MPLIEQITTALQTGIDTVVVPSPGAGPGHWAGAPSVAMFDGEYYLAYRLRRPVGDGRGYAVVIARSPDGVAFQPICTFEAADFGAASLERPALIRTETGWRIYLSCATPGSKHWWVEAVDAPTISDLPQGMRTVVLAGDPDTAWRDPVVHHSPAPDPERPRWQMWACKHLLDMGDDYADRMQSWYFTSDDGLAWTTTGPALLPTAATWDRRGVRITNVLQDGPDWIAHYDGRASAAENWHERTGVALGSTPAEMGAIGEPLERDGRPFRYLNIVPLSDRLQLFYEATNSDGSHDLRTQIVMR